MLKYVDLEIEGKIKATLEFLNEHDIDYAFYDINNADEFAEEDVFINYETKIEFSLEYTENYEESTLGSLFESLIEVQKAKLIDNYLYISPKRILIRIESKNERYYYLSKIKDIFQTQLNEKDQVINFDLLNGYTNFGVFVAINGSYDKDYPPVLYEDMFIQINSIHDINENMIEELLQAYIFELSTSLELEVFISPRQIFFDIDEYEPENTEINLRLRPILTGKGIKDLLAIFNSTTKVDDPEILILFYTKVIEYVSQTVVRREMLDTILNKLYSSRTLTPDASYVLELEKSFDDLGNYKKDKEAIRLTIETCCDVLELQGNVPKYLKNLVKINIDSSRDEKKQGLNELANAISDTRNMIAHAKTNYKNKGNECPNDEMLLFSKTLKIIASQVIRWFIRQHEDSRIF